MTNEERRALHAVRGYAGANRIILSRHADRRMDQRGASYQDVRHALMNARACRDQGDGTWRVDGPDLDGDDLTLVVALRDGVLVVTLF